MPPASEGTVDAVTWDDLAPPAVPVNFYTVDSLCLMMSPEECNGLDDNCNGMVDELWDFDNDPLNCGGCDFVCSFPRATAGCSMGQCVITDCDCTEFHDD